MSEPKPRLSIADVAKLAEVDRSVVSRVISNDANLKIREETRQRVKDVVARVGYRPNPLARSLRTQKAGALALLVPDFADPLYGAIAGGAEAEAAARDIVLVMARSADIEQQVERIGTGRVDGFVLGGTDLSPAAQRRLDAAGVAWLRLNRRGTSSRRYLIADAGAAAALAAQHLLELGHKRLAFAGDDGEENAGRARDGFQRALKRAGIEPAARKPTAVIAADAATAAEVVRKALAEGLNVPADLSVVALQDLPPAAHTAPPLTAVRMPLEQLGRRAVELLTTLPAEQSVREVLDATPELVIRGSTAPPARR